jgi:hypothetical protein
MPLDGISRGGDWLPAGAPPPTLPAPAKLWLKLELGIDARLLLLLGAAAVDGGGRVLGTLLGAPKVPEPLLVGVLPRLGDGRRFTVGTGTEGTAAAPTSLGGRAAGGAAEAEPPTATGGCC